VTEGGQDIVVDPFDALAARIAAIDRRSVRSTEA